jgi:putative DNA primase/helicase
MSNLTEALKLAQKGLYIIPLHTPTPRGESCSCSIPGCTHIGKHPRIKDWEKNASIDPGVITGWFKQWPLANIGIAVGKSGLAVIDIDPRNGGDIPNGIPVLTWTSYTGSGGVHLIYQKPRGASLRKSLAKGVDVLSDAHLIVAPPSLHKARVLYQFAPGLSPHDLAKPLPFPDRLIPLLTKPQQPPPSAYADTILKNEIDKLRLAANGNRNNTLNQAAFALGTVIGAGWLDRAKVESELQTAGLHLGLNAVEAAKTIKSGIEAGLKKPRYPLPSVGVTAQGGGATPHDYHKTDIGNAERLVKAHGGDLRYCWAWRDWLVWDGTRWMPDKTGEIRRRAKQAIRAIYTEAGTTTDDDQRKTLAKHGLQSENVTRVGAMIDLARSEENIPVNPELLDTHPYLLNCENGTVDLTTGTLKPHDRSDLLTKCAPVTYDPGADCPLWGGFLNQVMGGNSELVSFLQRAIGYTLTGDASEQVLFILYGLGANGKSVFVETIQGMLGEDFARSIPTGTIMASKYGDGRGPSPDLARLAGARMVTVNEVNEDQRIDESLIKQATGGDTMTARYLHSNFFEFKPQFKLFIRANHKPIIQGSDNAIWRRMRMIPFTVTIPPDRRDPDLTDKLRGEWPGILAWAVRGCMSWQQDRLAPPDSVLAATRGYQSEMDVVQQFLDQSTQPGNFVGATDLYKAYSSWCEDNGYEPTSQHKFGRKLSSKGYVKERLPGLGRNAYVGINLTP